MADEMKAAGYVIINETAIWGVGKTEAVAWEYSIEWIEADDETGPLQLALDHDGLAIGILNSNALGFTAELASAALVAHVTEMGTPNSWGILRGIQCTNAEEADEEFYA